MQDMESSGLLQEKGLLNIEYVNEDEVVGSTLLNDINGKPAFTLEVDMPREIHQQGESAAAYLFNAMIILGIVYGLVLVFSLEKYVLSRLSLLSRNLTTITEEGLLSSRVKMDGNDELHDLSANINYMLETLEENENKIQRAELESKQRMESIVENVICGVLVIDEKTHMIIDANPVAEDIIGLPRDKIIDNLCHQFVCPAEKGNCPISDLGENVNRSERLLISAKGEKIPILKSVVSVSLSDRKYLIESFVDLRRIKETENDLILAKIVAESANRAKSDFLATMSHEFRTPLNSVIGFSDLMISGSAGEMTYLQTKFLGNISASGKHLLSLINNILDLSKIEANKMELNYEIFSVENTFSHIKMLVSPLADKKGVIVEYSLDEDLTNICADIVRFKQIFFNLVSNAIKFTPKGGKVTISGTIVEDRVRFSVKDTGIGISKEDIGKLFHPFTQLDSATNRQYEGTGLGLSLVKRFVELHNGTIWVESEPGEGTTFTFELPSKECLELKSTDDVHPGKESRTESTKTVLHEKIQQSYTENSPLVLVVEDDDNSRELLVATLTSENYQVMSVTNGKEALELVSRKKPFAITLNIMMPEMDGWNVLKLLKEDENTADIPVIIVTMLDEMKVGTACGAIDHLIKPVQKEDLLRTLEKIKEKTTKPSPEVLLVDDDPLAVKCLQQCLKARTLKFVQLMEGRKPSISHSRISLML